MSSFGGFAKSPSVPVEVPLRVSPKEHLVVPTEVALGVQLEIPVEVPSKILVISSGICI